jgi:hypothetical protein
LTGHVLASWAVRHPQSRLPEHPVEVAVVQPEKLARIRPGPSHKLGVRIDYTNARQRGFGERVQGHDNLILSPSSLVDLAQGRERPRFVTYERLRSRTGGLVEHLTGERVGELSAGVAERAGVLDGRERRADLPNERAQVRRWLVGVDM